jgi:hypothetical protein
MRRVRPTNPGLYMTVVTKSLRAYLMRNPFLSLRTSEIKEKLKKCFEGFRTFGHTLDTQAIEMKVAQDETNVVNCWNSIEKAKE